MRLDRPYLLWRALCVLSEIARCAEEGAVVSDHALRFLLGFLYTASDGTRAGFDIFATQLRAERTARHQDTYGRCTYLNSGIAGIIRAIGPNPTGAVLASIGQDASYEAFRAAVQHQIDMGERPSVRPGAWI